MTDHFALLDEPRRPWIDPDALKQKFLARSAQIHPDRVHGAPEAERRAAGIQYTELNAAYHCLREPKERLRHLLELERGAKPTDIERIPAEMTEMFFAVGTACREADAFLSEKAKVSSPIVQAQMFERGQECADKLMALQQGINERREQLQAELKTMNAAWEAARANRNRELPGLSRLEEIYRLLGYFGRWTGQLQERIVQLSL